MIIDFNKAKELKVSGMNNESGDMSAKMHIDDEGKLFHALYMLVAA